MHRNALPARIIATLRKIGPSAPLQISEALALPRKAHSQVRTALKKLVRLGHVTRTAYGRYGFYEAVPNVPESGLTKFERIERRAVAALAELGSAPVEAIFRAIFFTCTAPRVAALPEYKVLSRVLIESPHFTRDGSRRWALSGE